MSNISRAHPALATALQTKGYATLTPVQDAVLDPALQGQDLLVSAQTGSGKTVAFGLAMASSLLGEDERLSQADAPLALCIAPTRELALQVKRELDWLYRDAGATVVSCVGGMDSRTERAALGRGAHIVVGTPGRLCDHLSRRALDLSELRTVALDEADEMLKMGFREELETILDATPDERRTLMFSATVPQSIMGMTRKYQRDAVRVNTAAEAKQHLDIDYKAMSVSSVDRENAIINVLRYYDAKNAIVFADTRLAVNRMVQRLSNRGFAVVALSGELSQSERSHALQAMRDGRAKVCVATDVAARGLDLPDLALVIHADVPRNREALLHRSGRTGRAGRKGTSVLIIAPNRKRNAERLLRDANITAEWSEAPNADAIIAKDNERMLENMTLDGSLSDEEQTLIVRLLKAHSPEHIAAAFIRQYRAGQSAPEDLLPADAKPTGKTKGKKGSKGNDDSPRSTGPRPTGPRDDFEGGIWFSLNVGRKQKAEPKWILPMLIKSGGLKKAEIGAIRITERATFIEVAPRAMEDFVKTIGPDGKIEAAITATRLDGRPDLSKPAGHQNAHEGRSKPSYKKTSKPKPSQPKPSRPKLSEGDAAMTRKPRKSPDGIGATDKPKKPHKKKLARAAALKAQGGSTKGGSTKKGGAGKKGGVKKGERKNTRRRKP